MQKDHLEILLEDIRGKFELVLEGHASLHEAIQRNRVEASEKHDNLALLLQAVNQKIDAVASELAAHRVDTEAHHGVWRVKE